MKKLICLVLLCVGLGARVSAQQVDLPRVAVEDEVALAKAMPGLAKEVLANYKEPDREKYLDNLFRLQLVAERYAQAITTLKLLREVLRPNNPNADGTYIQYEIYSAAKLKQAATNLSFDEAFRQSFSEVFKELNDKLAYLADSSFRFDLASARNGLQSSLDQQKEMKSIAITEAVALIRKYQPYRVYHDILQLVQSLVTEDDNRRYEIRNDVLIKTKGGATISAVVVRRKGVTTPQPTALTFTIYAIEGDIDTAKFAAAHGYVGMVAFTRGKALSPDPVAPYEHEVEDAYDVIDWISKQPWSDRQVGMFGGSYNGFSQWAATKKLHPALKTIVPYVAAIPGLGLPMENNVFLNANYGWAFYVTDNKFNDNETYNNPRRWQTLNDNWYLSGKPYRELDRVDGTPNKWLQRWLQHPSYDKYWQGMVPYRNDFARINIPVLTITGYYDDGQISALQYFKEHYKYNQNANHYLLIGPYDHFGAQRSLKDSVLRGYAIDPVAQIDTPEITFQWLDYIIRGGKKPELLKDKVNFEVMGANEWKHGPSLEKISNQTLMLYLTDTKVGDHYQLSKQKPGKAGALSQEVDLADRKTSTNTDYYPFPIVGIKPDLSTGFSFISEPFDEPVEINGTFSGEIKASINKKDMDIGVVLYEVMPNGELFHLSYFLGRASYAKDMSVRHLLTPGQRESIPFDRTRMVSRRLSKGSRLLVILNVNKNNGAQVNFGTGKDVSDEDIKDGKVPLKVKWQNDSYVKIPIWR